MDLSIDANLILVNARLWSPGFVKPRNGAIALGGGRIVRTGSNEKCEAEAAKNARIVDVGRRLILPGFNDAHAHLIHTGPRMKWLQLQDIPSLDRLLKAVSQKAQAINGTGWIHGRGWDESKWPERRNPSRVELDSAARGVPVLLRRVDGHMCVANTAALRRLRIPESTDGFVLDSKGNPTGVLHGRANDLAVKRTRPSVRDLVECFPLMQSIAHTLGITSIHDIIDEGDLDAYQRLHGGGKLGLRIYLMPLMKLLPRLRETSAPPRYGDDWLRFGAIKLFADGSLGARTAALYGPYADDGDVKGQLEYRERDLKKAVRKAHRLGFHLGIHAIGDRAIDAVIDAYDEALRARPRDDHRHRIEHFELPTEEALDRCSDLGIVPVMQPNFVMQWSWRGGLYDARLGRRRSSRNNPHGSILRKGLSLAFGSDGMPYGPIYGLQGAVRPPFPRQRIPLHRALEAYTIGGAFASFEEQAKGNLLPGNFADLVVIDGKWDDGGENLDHWKVAATIVGGVTVYGNPETMKE